jgi:hypothetical protein
MDEAVRIESEREAADERRSETINDMIYGLHQQIAKLANIEAVYFDFPVLAGSAIDVRVHLESLIGRLENL